MIVFFKALRPSLFVSAMVAETVEGSFISTSLEMTFVVALLSRLLDDCN